MSKRIILLATVGIITLLGACAREEEEFVVVDPEPISTEPVQTGKFK
jgi:hypothetical protein